ncbi:MAG: hypothetical protein V5A68_00980 [Candidatus Thermoplasmatota archaeon]
MEIIKLIQIVLVLFCIVGIPGLVYETDVYDEVYSGIVSVKCLSCLKLDPATKIEYVFDTQTGEEHPGFIRENLTEGIVFLHFSEDACKGCDIMLPIVQDLFNVSFGKKETFYKRLEFKNHTLNYFYVNIDHSKEKWNSIFKMYDKDDIGGLPMFSIVSVRYNKGIVKPYYTSLYSTLNRDTNEKREDFLNKIVNESFELYDKNIQGYQPDY